MRHALRGFAAALVVLAAERVRADGEPPRVLPHDPPRVAPAPPPTAEFVAHVEGLVDRLPGATRIRAWAPWWDDDAPPERTATAQDEAAASADRAMAELVTLGPRAMPALLAHLDDPRPTRLRIGSEEGEERADFGIGKMWLSAEVPVNPARPAEVRAVARSLGVSEERVLHAGLWLEPDSRERTIPMHVCTVGDLCFWILGIVTNRHYDPARGQPTMCIVVNSPTREPRIARAVRALWAGSEPWSALVERLVEDFHTLAPESPATAALDRLLWYYPEVGEAAVIACLDAVDPRPGTAPAPPSVAQVDASAVARSAVRAARPAFRDPLARLARRTSQGGVLREVLPAIPEERDAALHDHLRAVIDRAANEFGADHDVQALLLEVGRRWPDRYADALLRCVENASAHGLQDVLRLAYESEEPLPLAVGVWRGLLQNRSKATEWQGGGSRLPSLRVCDVAAREVARRRPALAFDESLPAERRDEQIEAMRGALRAEASGGPK